MFMYFVYFAFLNVLFCKKWLCVGQTDLHFENHFIMLLPHDEKMGQSTNDARR
jgi:hypothetical protein